MSWLHPLIEHTIQLEIVDFGASRAYSEHFSNLYKEMIVSGIEGRSEDCEAVSRELGFLVDEDGPVSLCKFQSLADLLLMQVLLSLGDDQRARGLGPCTWRTFQD